MKPEPDTASVTEACAILHCGRSTLYNRVKLDPTFPAPIKIGKATCWYLHELRAYVATCAARRLPASTYAAERAIATEQVSA